MLKLMRSIQDTSIRWKILMNNIKRTDSQERLQIMITTTHALLQITNLKTQHNLVSVYYLFLPKATCFGFGINHPKVTIDVHSGLVSETSLLQTQTWFVTLLSWDLEPEITMFTSQNIFVSADLDNDILNFYRSYDVDEGGFFENRPVNLWKQHFPVQNITT